MERTKADREGKRHASLKGRFLRKETIEERADLLLDRYAQFSGRRIEIPVPVERIAEDCLDLISLWEPIQSKNGRQALAKLKPMERRVIFNETYLSLFGGTPGLERTTLGHEIGHWELHFDKSLLKQPGLPGFGEVDSYVTYKDGAKTPEEWQAHAFMGYLLMPRSLLLPLIRGKDLLNWHELYQLRDQLQVTISALTVRLQALNLVYVLDNGDLVESKEVHNGQMRFQ